MRVRRIIAGSAAALAGALALGASAAHAATLFADGFESGDFSAWSQVQTAVDGTAAVQSKIVKTGAVAAQLSESATAGSKAYVRKTLSAPQQDLTATGDFQVVAAGVSGGNVPLFRLLDPGGTRLISVYRQNDTKGTIGIAIGSTHPASTGTLALGTWANVSLHVITAGAASTVEVRLNGSLVYSTTAASLGTAGVSTTQIGNDTAAQAFNLVADNISVDGSDTAPASPPANAVKPVISGTPQQGQTLTVSTGTWNGTQPITYAYQWRRCDSGGLNCTDIAGATGASYTATATDVGGTLVVAVTATNSAGNSTANSNPSGVVQSSTAPPSNTALPTIAGTAQDTQVLSAAPGGWSGSQPMTFGYQWQRCNTSGTGCGAISGATGVNYTLTSADVGSTIRVAVTATNSAGFQTATSAATGTVQAAATLPGAVALWHMNETSGSVMKDSVGSHDGTIFSAQLGVPGFSGTAYGFAGKAYVSVPAAADLNPGSSNVTLTIHVKTTSAPATPDWDLFRKGLYTTPGGEFKMEYQPSGQASCGFNGSSNYSELMAGPAINDGTWHTVQCVKTASGIKVVVDGTAYSKTATIGTISNTEPVPIGARPGSEYFQGALDEASIQIG
jgi:Concanavalin A-like lectin/glucanases superfamily